MATTSTLDQNRTNPAFDFRITAPPSWYPLPVNLVKERKRTRAVNVRDVTIGGGAPVVVQSMTTSYTHDFGATMNEIARLADAGCQLVRVAVPEERDAAALPRIVRESPVPIIADIHFDAEMAILAIKAGVAKIRLNPGTIRTREKVAEISRLLVSENVPIRIGSNSGSIPPQFRKLYEHDQPEALVQSVLHYIEMIKEHGVEKIVVSLKSSDALNTVAAYRRFSEISDYPLHVGVTEAGPGVIGTARSTVGLTMLLAEGIGDTMRVSLTEDSVQEVRVCFEILQSLGLPASRAQVKLISCPTCGRISFDLLKLVAELEEQILSQKKSIKVALMGCAVNGPGEAKEADIGIAGGTGKFVLFKKGEVFGKNLSLEEARKQLLDEICRM